MKILKRVLPGILLIVIVAAVIYYPKLKHVYMAVHFRDKDVIVENFTSVNKNWKTREIKPPPVPYIFPKGRPINLPKTFSYKGKTYNSKQYLDSSFTTDFLVLQNDSLAFEKYYLSNNDTNRHLSFSMQNHLFLLCSE